MLDAVPLLATTIILIFIFSYFFVSLQLSEIRANWNERRCDPFVIPIAHLVPKDSVDASDFAINNFQYCLSKLIDTSISTMMYPVLSMFNSQMAASGQIQTSINYLRANAKSLLEPLNAMFQALWNKIKIVLYGVARIYSKLASSFNRIFGIAVSSIFAGIGVYKGIRNLLNLVIYIIVVILTIILVIIIFAAFLIAPILPVTLLVITTIGASVFGASVAGMEEGICVAPGTLVAVKDGWKAVEDLKLGDELREGIVEGILKTVGARCVSIEGVILSESHILFDLADSKWKTAGNHSMAIHYEHIPKNLYCLNTSTHRWIVKGNVELTLLDWDEIPDEYDVEWERIVNVMLNGEYSSLRSVPGRGLLGEDTLILEKTKGLINISKVAIGDYIKDDTTFTEVIGVYKDIVTPVPRSGVNKAGWIFNKKWIHGSHTSLEKEGNAYSLVTRSGTFSTDCGVVRDFTEVGADRIDQTYDFVLSLLASNNRNDEAHNVCD